MPVFVFLPSFSQHKDFSIYAGVNDIMGICVYTYAIYIHIYMHEHGYKDVCTYVCMHAYLSMFISLRRCFFPCCNFTLFDNFLTATGPRLFPPATFGTKASKTLPNAPDPISLSALKLFVHEASMPRGSMHGSASSHMTASRALAQASGDMSEVHAHAHAHAIFISTTTKPLPDLAADTDYVTPTLTAFTTTPICKIAPAWD
jgi:hypothetical protein